MTMLSLFFQRIGLVQILTFKRSAGCACCKEKHPAILADLNDSTAMGWNNIVSFALAWDIRVNNIRAFIDNLHDHFLRQLILSLSEEIHLRDRVLKSTGLVLPDASFEPQRSQRTRRETRYMPLLLRVLRVLSGLS